MQLDHGTNGSPRTGNGSWPRATEPDQPDSPIGETERSASAYLAQPEAARIAFMVADLAQSLTSRRRLAANGSRATARRVRPFLSGHHA